MLDSQPKVSFGQYRELLVRYLGSQRRAVALFSVLMLISLGLQLVNPQILRHFIDSLGADTALSRLVSLALVFTGVALAQQVVSVFEAYTAAKVGWTATNALRDDLAGHALSLDMSYHNDHTPGDMIERIDGDADTMADSFWSFVVELLADGLLLVGVLVLLFLEDWRAGAAITSFVVVSFAGLSRLHVFAALRWKAARDMEGEAVGFVEERISGTEDIRSSGAKPHVMNSFFMLLRRWRPAAWRSFQMFSIMINTTFSLFGAVNAIALAVGAYLFLDGSVTIGTVYLIFHYSNMLGRPIESYAWEMANLQEATGSIYRILELTRTRSRIVEGRGSQLPAGPLSVAFDEVSFAYDGGDSVLKEVGFDLKPGRTLGLLGRTGSGKTTLSRLLVHLYDPGAGTVRLGDVDVRDASLADLRRRVSMVTQDVQLFHGTVRDNLTFFDPSVSDERLRGVIGELGLSEWLDSMPEGLDMTLQSGGGGLSAGEAQLLAFTRVFLSDAGLVVLDEASSRLDRSTEALVQRAVRRLEQDRTVIIIAHHLVTVERVDEIMILQEGRVLEHGDREALAADRDSRFTGLLRTGLEEVLA